MSTSYALAHPVPVEADKSEVERARAEAVERWFADVERSHLVPAGAPDADLVDVAVGRMANGRVVIAQVWRVWGPVNGGLVPPSDIWAAER